MTQAQLLRLEEKAIVVDSEEFEDVTYAIEKEGKGMWIIVGKKIIAVADPLLFIKEINEVWEHMKPRG
jgi:hypothetical protein